MKNLLFATLSVCLLALGVSAQLAPRESTRQELTQMISDTKVTIVYHRPNSKGRGLWGCETTDAIPKGGVEYPCLVPNGQVWRTGANEATTFEVSGTVMINGQKLEKGKYALFTIPSADKWTIIFSKKWDQWGSFSYDAKDDALRVSADSGKGPMMQTMTITFDDVVGSGANATIRWGEVAVPFSINVGDVAGRMIEDVTRRMAGEPAQLANYVVAQKLTARYAEVLNLLDAAIKTRETFGNLNAKARLLAEMGRFKEAVETGEKAVAVGKAAKPNPANTSALEKLIVEWKMKK